MEGVGCRLHADRAGPALRLRAGGLGMRAMFVVYLVLIVAGIAYVSMIGLLHN
jgi:hypothetical protein